MNATEQRQIKSALDRIVERTPDLGPTPDDLLLRQPEPRSNWRPLIAVAAATVVLVGVGVLAANRQSPAENAVAPATQPEQTESSQSLPDVAATDTVLLAPAALPDGYVLYSASNRVDTNPLEGNADHIFGPPDARPDQIVEVGAGTDVEGIPCGSAAAPITISNEPQFCTDRPVAAKQLRWNIGEVAIVIWGGSSVADETLPSSLPQPFRSIQQSHPARNLQLTTRTKAVPAERGSTTASSSSIPSPTRPGSASATKTPSHSPATAT